MMLPFGTPPWRRTGALTTVLLGDFSNTVLNRRFSVQPGLDACRDTAYQARAGEHLGIRVKQPADILGNAACPGLNFCLQN